ncbi:unnamed protein product, partial [Symbiodinium microadriaticum]
AGSCFGGASRRAALAARLSCEFTGTSSLWPSSPWCRGQIRFGKAYRAEALGNLLSGGFSTYLLSLAGIAVSRRLCNLPYVLHILSLNACVPGPPMSYARGPLSR